MNVPGGQIFQKLTRLLAAPTVEPNQRAARILAVEKDIVMPIKGLLVLILFVWFLQNHSSPDVPEMALLSESARQMAWSWIRIFFWFYIAVNGAMAAFYISGRPSSLKAIQWTVFAMGVLDCALIVALTFLTNGYDTIVYWAFPVLILRNAMSIPVAFPQLALNVLLSCCYLFGGMADKATRISDGARWNILQKIDKANMDALKREKEKERSTQIRDHVGTNTHHTVHSAVLSSPGAAAQAINSATPEAYKSAWNTALADYESRPDREDQRERFIVLLTWAICCYGIQALFEKQKKAEAEATEFAVRQERLHTAGRLAAEIAHQIKNPLGIITNAAFCLQRSVHEGSTAVDEQVQIIREEINRADQIITELMGYAQLAEGTVEKLEVDTEVDQAILDVFPRAAKYDVLIRRDYAPNLPALLMQKRHLSGVLVNIVQNAHEAMNGHGQIDVTIRYDESDSILITIADNGPGIAPDKIDKIFQAYFTTRAKGTGLGLAIVKHNTEMYGGTVHVESELGKGTRFLLKFPARILMKLNK
ncbi:MAG: two-component system sensor histidine kinase NtrB [Limisphaerales bacterium]